MDVLLDGHFHHLVHVPGQALTELLQPNIIVIIIISTSSTKTIFITITVIIVVISTLFQAATELGALAAGRLDLWHLHLLLHGLDHGDVHLDSKLEIVSDSIF